MYQTESEGACVTPCLQVGSTAAPGLVVSELQVSGSLQLAVDFGKRVLRLQFKHAADRCSEQRTYKAEVKFKLVAGGSKHDWHCLVVSHLE